MANGIILSAGVRQNLLSLQNTADLASLTQNRLATGKKVNSASDNAISFFTSSNLQNRASDLNDLLDNIGQAQKTLDAASQGLSSLTSLVQSAKSIAKQASQVTAPTQSYAAGTAATATATAETKGTFTTSGTYPTTYTGGTLSFSVNVNGTATTVTTAAIADDSDADTVVSAINAALTTAGLNGNLVASNASGQIKLDAQDVNTDVTINANAVSASLNLTTDASTNRSVNSTNLLDTIVANGGTAGSATLSVTVGSGTAQTITFGTGSGQIHDLAGLNTALGALTGVTASAGGTGNTAISIQANASASANGLTIAGSTGVLASLGGLATSAAAGATVISTPDTTRSSLQTDFNNLLTQIDQLAKDASYNGINLLSGDNLKVTFNEKGTSSLTISGVTFDSAGLGLSSVSGSGTTSFQDNTKLDSVISSLDTALSTLRTQASKFGTNLTTVQTRQDFTKNLINTLQTGADSLVLADTNQEGANLLALQTRQQLSTTALSLANQASQAVLRLF